MTDDGRPGEGRAAPDIALIVLDTLRKDYFDEYFDWLPGETIDHAWSTSHWTVPAHASLFTGQYAGELGVHTRNPRLNVEGSTLAERLQTAGYETLGFSCNPHLSPEFGFVRGFEDFRRNWVGRQLDADIYPWGSFVSNKRFDGPLRYPEAIYRLLASDYSTRKSLWDGLQRKLSHTSLDLPDRFQDHGAQAVLADVRNRDWSAGTPTFYFANLMETHIPYNPPVEYQTDGVDNGGYSFATLIEREGFDPAVTRQAYEDCVRYLSDVYRKIVAELQGHFDYVITISDHGEHLGESGLWGHNFGVAPPLTNIPFHVIGPRPPAVEGRPVSLLDVHATVLDLAGCERGPRGTSIYVDEPDDENHARLTEYHGICNEPTFERLRAAGIDGETVERYDSRYCGVALSNGYYGYETPNGFVVQGDTDRDASEILEALKQEAPVTPIDQHIEYSEATEEQLRALGYA